jgi:hypothetical protein
MVGAALNAYCQVQSAAIVASSWLLLFVVAKLLVVHFASFREPADAAAAAVMHCLPF